jgi:uncharacterized protein YbjT (DUF2867 family)
VSRVVVIGATGHVGTYLVPRETVAGGLAAGVAGWFGREPQLELVDWPEFERQAGGGQDF